VAKTTTPGARSNGRRSASKAKPTTGATPRIIIFSCQWAPHYAFQSLYRRGRRGEGDGVRVLTACVGRVGEDLVLEAFRRGADGVAVLSCPPELCRHGLDHGKFQTRLGSLRALLRTLGIPPTRFLVSAFQPHEGERLAAEIEGFSGRVAAEIAAGGLPSFEVAP
jgi:coenzyme F420-reducing hydrogenase delta subunit